MIVVTRVVLVFLIIGRAFAQPTISSFSPPGGPIGTEVRISGSGFDSNPANNFVFFGGAQAVVTSATSSELTAIVPAGAANRPASVLVNGLIGYSSSPFHVAFGGSGMDMNSFGPGKDFSQTGGTDQILVADLDGDGRNDLLVLRAGKLSVLRNVSAASGIDFGMKQDLLAGPALGSFAIGELDGDGKPDLAVTSLNGFNISIFRNTSENGAISFGPQRDFVPGGAGAFLSLADVDGDGKTDIAMKYTTSEISVFRNTSDGIGHISFAAPAIFNTGKALLSVLLTDLNNDNKPDFSGLYSSGVVVLKNTGSPGTVSYAMPVSFSTTSNVRTMTLGDLDKDARPDLVLTFTNFRDNVFYDAYFHTILNTSTSNEISFGSPKQMTTQNVRLPGGVSTGDLDGDGATDLVIFHNNYFVLYRNLLLENASADFVYEATFEAAPVKFGNGIGATLAPIDNDGKIDIVTFTNYTDYVSVFRNKIVSLSNDVLTFNFPGQIKPTEINRTDHTINLEMPGGTDLKSLVPSFTLPYGAQAKVGGITQESGVTKNDFTNFVIYSITAEDGVTTQDWVVNVSREIVTAIVPESHAFYLYPNPVYQGFTLTGITGDASVLVVDLYGRSYRSQRIRNSQYVDLQDLPQGLYFVILKDERAEHRIKILKK